MAIGVSGFRVLGAIGGFRVVGVFMGDWVSGFSFQLGFRVLGRFGV